MEQVAGIDLYAAIADREGATPASMALDKFIERLRAVTAGKDRLTGALNDLGARLFREKAYPLAHHCYEQASRHPQAIGARANLGRCEIRLGRPERARAIAASLTGQHPDEVAGWVLLGEASIVLERFAEAVAAYERAAQLKPDQPGVLTQLGLAHTLDNNAEAACTTCERGLALNPDDVDCLHLLTINKRRICDWRDLDELSTRLKAAVANGLDTVWPINFISEGPTAAEELNCSRLQARRAHAATAGRQEPWQPFKAAGDGKLRVGFVGYGFGAHPTAILTSAVFEALKDSPIEAHLFALSDEALTQQRQRLMEAAHRFHPVAGMSSLEVARRVREEGVEILVDMDGFSRGARPEIFAHRAAPVQILWLGYPGTSGADFIDYVVADPYVLPASMRKHFSEQPLYLPRFYMSTDPTRVVPAPPSRSACGLPDDHVVYVCFNATYKLNQRSMERMFRVLHGVPKSVLWLQASGRVAERLQHAALDAGIAPERLVFMDKLPHEIYLARYRLADLFLDTEYYNAHTTATDALWAGCPVLTRPGDTFATRVAGSLNHHLGMPEMNVDSDEAFVAAAIRYGLDAELRKATRAKLMHLRTRSSVFDSNGFARDLINLLQKVSAHHRRGGRPAQFRTG
ncbi:tetratricopeptide repeat protein [Dyella kyungheensis]